MKNKIPEGTRYLMLGVAAFIDLMGLVITILPAAGQIANEFLSFFGNLIFLLWFWLKGISLFNKKRILNFLGNYAGEVVTAGIWAGFTVMTYRAVKAHNKEVAEQKQGEPETNAI